MSRGWVPFRGDGFSTKFKSRKRFINLEKLRRLVAKEVLQIIAAVTVVTFCILGMLFNSGGIDGVHIVGLILGWIVVFTFIVGIIDLNRFRKGHDIDTSKGDTNENNEPDQEHND